MTSILVSLVVALSAFGGPHRAVEPMINDVTSVRGDASWYCRAGASACTRGYPSSGLFAAAGSALRVGAWRGRVVTIAANGRRVRATLIDWCGCPDGRIIDLYASTFSRLAPLGAGVVNVEISW